MHQNRPRKTVVIVCSVRNKHSGGAINCSCTSLHEWCSLCQMANKLTKFIRWQSEGKKKTKTANAVNAAFDSEVSFR